MTGSARPTRQLIYTGNLRRMAMKSIGNIFCHTYKYRKVGIIILCLAMDLAAGCAPSIAPLSKYAWDGQFYSEHYKESQILNMERSKAISVRHIKLSSGGCGVY